MENYKIKAIRNICNKLNDMIDDIVDYYKDEKNKKYIPLEVYPEYGYEKFFLDWVEKRTNSYDMTLKSLINFMLHEDGHYKRLLSKETFKKVSNFNQDNPVTLYGFDDKEEFQTIKDIENTTICCVMMSLKKHGLSYRPFVDAGYDIRGYKYICGSLLSHISQYGLVNNIIVDSYLFLLDLREFISKNDLSETDMQLLLKVLENSGRYVDYVYTGELLYKKYPSFSKELFRKAMLECKKKSECTILAITIKKTLGDDELMKEVYAFKEKL